MVSIIVTTYGRFYQEIKATIESILNQSYRNIELILIDDNGIGSPTQIDVQNEIKKIKTDIPVRYLPNEKNSGAQISRNKGILASRGDYVAFLDDDDLWNENKLEKQIYLFSDIEVGLVYCKGWLLEIDNGYKKPYNMSEAFLNTLSFEDLSYGDYIGTTSQVIVRKDVFAVCGLFDTDQPARQDYEMWIRISQSYKCKGVEEFLFTHIIHSGEQISKNPQKGAIGIENIYYKYNKKCSPTAKWHLLWLSYTARKKAANNLTTLKWLIFSIVALIKAVIFDTDNFKYRMQLHNKRKNALIK